jgi:hypothetical protein
VNVAVPHGSVRLWSGIVGFLGLPVDQIQAGHYGQLMDFKLANYRVVPARFWEFCTKKKSLAEHSDLSKIPSRGVAGFALFAQGLI